MRVLIVAMASLALACCLATTLSAGPPNDCSAAAIPNRTAQGKIGTATFVPDRVTVSTVNHPGLNGVTYDAYDLRFTMRDKAGEDMALGITTIVAHGGSHEGKTFRMLPTKDTPRQPMAGPGAPEVQGWDIEYDRQNIRASFVGAIGSLRVEYGTRKGDVLPGRISFCTPAAKGSFLAGSFAVDLSE